jgi:hypothetical protein
LPGAGQPDVDAGLAADDFVESQMILPRDVRQGVFCARLGLSEFADDILTGFSGKSVPARWRRARIRARIVLISVVAACQ